MHDNDDSTNGSANRPFQEVLQARSRRDVLAGGLATAVTSFVGAPVVALAEGGRFGHRPSWLDGRNQRGSRRAPLVGFEPVPVAEGNGPWPQISPDYEFQVLIPWGEPLMPGGPRYDGDPRTRPNSVDQTMQIGIG